MIADVSRKHEIITFQFQKSNPLLPRCVPHNKERCEMYCNLCHIPVCSSCLASKEHLGHELSKTLQALEEKKEEIAKEKNEFQETIYPTYLDIVSDVQNRMSQLEKECGYLSKAITKLGEDLHREIDKLVHKLKAEVEEIKTIQLHTLQKHLDEVNKKISDINDEIHSMDVALDSNDMSKVFSVMPKVDEYKKLPPKILPSSPKFTPGRIHREELSKLFGTLSSISVQSEEDGYSIKTTQKSPEAASPPVIKQLLDEPQTVTTIHIEYCLNNVACPSDEEIWTCGDSNTMKLYSINQGSLLKSITTKSGNTPEDIAVTNSGDLVYTDYWNRTVNIVKNEEIQTVIRLQNWKPRGVCCTESDDLLVIMNSDDYKPPKVVRYSGSTETQTIQFDDQDHPLYSLGYHERCITENRNLDICMADYGADAVVVVNQAGKLRFRYIGHTLAPQNKPFCPRGIATNSQSHIITTDHYNKCVHIIYQDGQFLRYIDCGLRKPWGLCIDTNDNLFVAQFKNKRVKKIKYLTYC
jgi:gas vesicle protein